MSRIKIQTPLYAKRNVDFSWRNTPALPDIPMETIHLQEYNLYPFAKKLNRRYEYTGSQWFVIPPDIPMETIHLREYELPVAPKRFNKKFDLFSGWQRTPLSADFVAQDDLYTRQWTDITKGRNKQQYQGQQSGPLADDNDVSFSQRHTVYPVGRNKHTYVGIQRQPTPADNSEASARFEYVLPELGTRPLRYSYDGWTQIPLVADNELAQSSAWTDLTKGRNKQQYQGTQQSPLANENNLASQITWTDLTKGRNKNSYIGWQVSPTIPDNFESFTKTHIELPELGKWPLRFTYEGLAQQPLSADVIVEMPANQYPVDWITGRDKNLYNGFVQIPLVEDNSLAAAKSEFEVPQSRDKHNYGTWTQSPLSGDFVQPMSFNTTEFNVPLSRDKNQYDGIQKPTVPANNEISAQRGVTDTPYGRDKNSYDGWQQAVVVADNDPAVIRVVTEIPQRRNKNQYSGFQQGPLAGDNSNSFAQVVVDVPNGRDGNPNTGFARGPMPGDVQDPVAGFTSIEPPVHTRRNRDFTFAAARAVPELVVQATMPAPWYDVPEGEVVVFEMYGGPANAPLSADAPVIVDTFSFRPTFRPRRR